MNRLHFLGLRLVRTLATLVIIVFITFAIFSLWPSDPATLACGRPCTPENLERARAFMGYDLPWYTQFWHYLRGVALRLDRRGGRRPVAGHRCGRRRRLRPQTRIAPGPHHHDRNGPGHLLTRLPCGAAGHPPVRLHPRHGAGLRLRPLRRQPPGLGLASHPALVRPRPHLRGRLRPHGAWRDAGEPRRGLRAHRARRRPARAPSRRPPRDAQHLPSGALLMDAVGTSDVPVVMGVTLVAAAFVVVANLVADAVATLIDPRL